MNQPDLVVLYEHPEWQKPLFSALEKRGVNFASFDLKSATFDVDDLPQAKLFFNQASPSAYVRGNTRAVPFALSLMQALETRGAKVLNGSRAFLLELSKSSQGVLMQRLGIKHPKTRAFNDVEAVLAHWTDWPCLLKPEQGGSGARMFLLQNPDELRRLLRDQPELWLPDNLLMLQQYFPVDPAHGIVRMEFVGQKFLYAMRVVSHGGFNLCPSEVCHPVDGEEGACAIPTVKPVEFYAYPEVSPDAIAKGEQIMREGGLDVGGIEFLINQDGEFVFYDVNANSNLRPVIAQEFGFDPFVRVVDYLVDQINAVT